MQVCCRLDWGSVEGSDLLMTAAAILPLQMLSSGKAASQPKKCAVSLDAQYKSFQREAVAEWCALR